MRPTRILKKRVRSLLHWSRQETELHDELALHFEQLVREHREAGLSECDARLAAKREFGNVPLVQEEARQWWGWTWLEDAWKDLGYGARLLWKSPGFTIAAVLSLGLGVGANTAVYGLMKQVMFDALPVRDPQNLVHISRSSLEVSSRTSFSLPFTRDLQAAEGIPFDGFLATSGYGQVSLVTEAGAESVNLDLVSGNFFELLGVRPALGRLFNAEDDRTVGGSPVAVLSYAYWNRRFGRDPSVLNRTVELDGRAFTIIGVSAAGFDGLNRMRTPDVQIPITMASYPSAQILGRGDWWLDVFGRVKPGVAIARAGDSLLPLLLRNYEIAGRVPKTEYQRRVRESERMFAIPAISGSEAPRSWQLALNTLLGMAVAVLLLACVNIANLLLSRASAREREQSVRAAIGASRGRLIRQQLTESLLLASLGGIAGVAMAYALSQMLVSIMVPDRAHSPLRAAPDFWLLAFNFVVAAAAGIVFGLAPAIRASRPGLLAGLKGTLAAGIGRMAMRKLLISAQIAVSVVLLMAAGLFARTLASFHSLDAGFRTDRLLEFGLDPGGYGPDQVYGFYQQVIERIATVPGVEASAVSRQRLMGGGHWGSGISVEGYTVHEGEKEPLRDAVSAGYFSAVGTPLIAGREFDTTDRTGSPKVAIVNEAFARYYFGGQNPVGKLIGEGGQQPNIPIVGMVRDARSASLREAPVPYWWIPYQHMQRNRFNALTLYARTAGDPEQIISSIREAVASVDRHVAMFSVRTLEGQLNDNLRVERALATLTLFFAGLAALLAAVGLFGVLAYSVARREREIGIRIALGATSYQAGWTVLREITIYVAGGLAAGLAIAWQAARFVESFLFGVQAKDATSLAFSCGAMFLIALLAAFLPARRAATVPPAVAFRAE